MVLAIWMFADVPATNLLGGDPARSIAALPDPAALRRLWYAKNIVLWIMAAPLCALVAVAIGIHEHEPAGTALTVLWIALAPLGALGFASWVGTWFPYHPLPLRDRWARRRNGWRILVRWALLVLTPYGVVPALTLLVTLPGALYYAFAARDGHVDDGQFGWGVLLAVATTVPAWLVGNRYGPRLASRRRGRLAAYLADPDRG